MVTSGARAGRLIPRWYAVAVVLLLALGVTTYAVMAAISDGAAQWAGAAWAGAFSALLLAAATALLAPRRPLPSEQTAGPTVVVASSPVLVGALLVAWGLALLAAAGSVVVALTDFDSIESPGFTLIAVLGALASLPDLGRLLTGRLHRWRLVLDETGVTYRGYRTDLTVPWAKLNGAAVQPRGPAGVVLDRKGSGADPVVPIAVLPVPADHLVALIEQRLARRGRRPAQ